MDRNSAPCAILATPISSSRERSSGVATTASGGFPGEKGSRHDPARKAFSVPRSHGSPLRSSSGRLLGGDIGHLRGRPERRIPEAQIVDDRRGNDRDHPRGGGGPEAAWCSGPTRPPGTSVIDPPIRPPQCVYIYRSASCSSIVLTVAARETYTFTGDDRMPERKEVRILGLDFGSPRTGVAVSDPLGITDQPR